MDQNERIDDQFEPQNPDVQPFETPESVMPDETADPVPETEPEISGDAEYSPFAYGVENGQIDSPVVPAQPQTSSNFSQVPPEPTAPAPKKKKNKGLMIFAIVLACVIAIIGSLSVGYYVGSEKGSGHGSLLPDHNYSSDVSGDPDNGSGNKSSFSFEQDDSTGDRLSTEQVVKTVGDSIVSITIYSTQSSNTYAASGIIMSADGYVLTNDHIYSDTPDPRFLITMRDGTEYHADYVSGDQRSDIAILKIKDGKDFKPAVFGSSEKLVEGESVLAIGRSAGLSNTVTNGIVSALNRRVSNSNTNYSEKFIQTTAAVNPGNSGGALVNMYGKVVGVTSSKIVDQQVEGVCFAIPIDRALSIVKELQENGKVISRAKIGITYNAVGTVYAELNDVPTGLYIRDIGSDSDLYGKGYTQGDIITKIDGKDIKSDSDVLDIIENSKVGQSIKLTIYKASTKKTSEVSIKLVQAESTSSYMKNSQQKSKDSSLPSEIEDFLPRNDDK